jgi:hypothetical protein
MRYVGGDDDDDDDDDVPDPQSWNENSANYTTHTSGGPYAYRIDDDRYEMIEARTCLAVGYYVFALFDVGGDGMCCAYGRGEYGINLSGRGGGGGGREIRPLSLGRFDGHVDATFFVVHEEDIDVLPPPVPYPSASSQTTNYPGTSPELPCASFVMHLVLDQFGNETSFALSAGDNMEDGNDGEVNDSYLGAHYPTTSPMNVGTSYLTSSSNGDPPRRKTQESPVSYTVILSGGPYPYKSDFESDVAESHYDTIIAEACLPIGSYDFVLYDVGGDGICCDYGRGEYGMKFVNGRVVRPLSHGEFSGASEVTQFDVMDVDIDVFPEEYARPDEGVVIEDVAGFLAQEGVPSPTLVDEVEDSPSMVDVSPEGSSETSIPDDANVSSGDSPLGDSGQIHDSAAPNVSAE